MMVSDEVLEAMGYRRLSEPESLSARFHKLYVFEVMGFTLDVDALPMRTGTVADRPYGFGVGASINAICQALAHQDFADCQSEWEREKRCTPPYVVVHLGPTSSYRFAGTYAIADASTVQTYRGFNSARSDLELWGQEVLPSILSGLASSFTRNDQPVKLRSVDEAFFGVTSDGRIVQDMRIVGAATAYASVRLTEAQVEEFLDSAQRVASNVREKVARFLYLAQQEDDALKRFLYSFLAIEVATNATFAEINRGQMLLAVNHAPAFAAAVAQKFLEDQTHEFKALGAKFAWCVMCVWRDISEDDVKQFKRLKDMRDRIAHGSLATPPLGAVTEAERLAAKLQLASL